MATQNSKAPLNKNRAGRCLLLFVAMILSSCNDRTQFRALPALEGTLVHPIPQDPVDPPIQLPEEPPVEIEPPLVDPPVVVEPTPVDPPVVAEPSPVEPPVAVEPPPVNPPPVVVEPPPIVVEPPPVVVEPPPVVPAPIISNKGICAPDSSTQLVSCMKCQVPLNPPAPPQFSEKGKSFIDMMAIGCAIPNKSAPKGYVAPTRAQLIARMSRLSPTLYPDSKMTANQKKLVADFMTDTKLQQKMFGGLWYQPPYSDYFETYFGVAVNEAVTNICYNATVTPGSNSPLQSKDFIDCTYQQDPWFCREKPEYVEANKYRDELKNAMIESLANPYVAPPATPSKKCKWESFEGDYEQGAEKKLEKWIKAGYKVGIEIGNLAGRCEILTALPQGSHKPRGHVKMAGYECK